MSYPSYDDALEQKSMAINQAKELEIPKMIRYLCEKDPDKKASLLGSGVIIYMADTDEGITLAAYRRENQGRRVFTAIDDRIRSDGSISTKILTFRYGAWVDTLIELYNRARFLENNEDTVSIMRNFAPLEGDWNDP